MMKVFLLLNYEKKTKKNVQNEKLYIEINFLRTTKRIKKQKNAKKNCGMIE